MICYLFLSSFKIVKKNNVNIDIGETTRTYIKDLSVSEKTHFFQDIRQVYCTITVSNDFRLIR